MYESFYGLRADPFRLSPDHRFCFKHRSYAKAKAYMQYALDRAEGFVMITGKPGTGKTTLINDLMDEVGSTDVVIATLVSTQLEASDLLRMVAFSFGLNAETPFKAVVLQALVTFFERKHREGRRLLLVIDEAQDLSPGALEELRLLTNLQRDHQPLLQIFLLGQESLRELVRDPNLEQVHQRLVAAWNLEPLGPTETRGYIRHRLDQVGWRNDPEIDEDVYSYVYEFSRGIPRRINLICGRLLLHGFVEELHQIRYADAAAVVSELQQEELSPAHLRFLSNPAHGESQSALEQAPSASEPRLDADGRPLHRRTKAGDGESSGEGEPHPPTDSVPPVDSIGNEIRFPEPAAVEDRGPTKGNEEHKGVDLSATWAQGGGGQTTPGPRRADEAKGAPDAHAANGGERRPVVDSSGELGEIFPSAEEAAHKEWDSKTTAADRREFGVPLAREKRDRQGSFISSSPKNPEAVPGPKVPMKEASTPKPMVSSAPRQPRAPVLVRIRFLVLAAVALGASLLFIHSGPIEMDLDKIERWFGSAVDWVSAAFHPLERIEEQRKSAPSRPATVGTATGAGDYQRQIIEGYPARGAVSKPEPASSSWERTVSQESKEPEVAGSEEAIEIDADRVDGGLQPRVRAIAEGAVKAERDCRRPIGRTAWWRCISYSSRCNLPFTESLPASTKHAELKGLGSDICFWLHRSRPRLRTPVQNNYLIGSSLNAHIHERNP